MEYMRLEGFLGAAASKLVCKAIENKIGFKPEVEIVSMRLDTDDADGVVQVKLTAQMPKSDFEHIIAEVTA